MQPQSLTPTPQQDEFCEQVRAATGHECKPYRAGIWVIQRPNSERRVCFSASGDIFNETLLKRVIQPALDSLYQ